MSNTNGAYGVFFGGDTVDYGVGEARNRRYNIRLDLSRAYTTANEFRMRNRLIRIYVLVSIDGIPI